MSFPAYARSRFITSCVLSLWAVSFAACSGTDDGALPPGGAAASGGSPSAGSTAAAGSPATAGAAPTAGFTSTAGATAAGGSTNTGGVPGAGGVSSTAGATQGGAAGAPADGGASGAGCHPKFASGVNVAWFNFASDIPGPQIPKFTALFTNVKAAGGSAVRWWFHTDGMVTPGYDTTGKAKPISSANIADLKQILDAAHAQGVGVVISLWSFGMLDSGQASDTTVRANNKLLLEIDKSRQAYIDNVLTPMVTALKGYPGLFAWEIFNEPEGMSSNGWTAMGTMECKAAPATCSTATINLQKTVNWFTSAIHTADPAALVTNGANNFGTLSPLHGNNLWSDSALTAAGGKANGTLDFYEVHYYNNYAGANANSPFLHPQSYWGLDKKVVIGEFWTDTTDGVAAADLYTNLYGNGYAGAWAWQYVSVDNPSPADGAKTIWPAMQVPMNNLKTAHAADLTCP